MCKKCSELAFLVLCDADFPQKIASSAKSVSIAWSQYVVWDYTSGLAQYLGAICLYWAEMLCVADQSQTPG